jgi:anti-sigma regulatory factor (Ser/Thr protein kinase)
MSSWDARRLVLRNDLAELQRLAGWIEGWAQRGVSADVSFAVQLCLEEAVANVIMYAGAKDSRLEIAVARIEDNGRHFDPTQVPPRSVASSLDEASVGDVGIHLIRSFASGMNYERLEGCNRLTLRFTESQVSSQRPG